MALVRENSNMTCISIDQSHARWVSHISLGLLNRGIEILQKLHIILFAMFVNAIV